MTLSDIPPRADGPAARSFHRSSLLFLAGCTAFVVVAVVLLDRLLHSSAPRREGQTDGRSSVTTAMANIDRMLLHWNLAKDGYTAPNLELPDIDSGRMVSLASLRGRPVVLLFGSFTCDLFCAQARELERLYQKFKESAAFLFVYVAEPGHEIPELEAAFADVAPGPAGRGERARRGRKTFGMTMPTVLDSEDMAAMLAYEASPKRLVCVDKEGRIAFDVGRGIPGQWDLAAVERYLDEWLH